MAWVSLLSQNKNLQKWFIMQCIKEGSTLRVSAKEKAGTQSYLSGWFSDKSNSRIFGL